ncbi:MAG: HAD family hydrolase [Candidatus Algichlamydia australiensis]|nr:HAD family hydrolase [Chlamydiales bacterium]
MLIVFDLDDTLIDTSGSVLPLLLQKVTEGLAPKSQKQLERMNGSAKSSKESINEFFEISDLKKQSLKNPSLHQIKTLDGVREVLRTLSLEHELALVTIGEESFQREKIKQAGIDLHLFSDVVVCKDKYLVYGKLIQKYSCNPSQVVVIGDRIDRDLTPAKLLGCKTIHIKWGRGVNFSDRRGHVDFAVSNLKQILDILPNIEIFS